MPRADLLLVVAVLVPTAALRLWRLDAVGFRGDEAVYAGQAAVLAGVDGVDRWFILSSRGNSNFLIFQGIVSVVYRVFGVDDLSARLVSAIFSILTVAVFCLLMFCRSDRAVWMYGLVASTVLTMQVKVVGVLLPILLLFAAAEGTWPRFTLRRMVTAAVVAMVFLAPTWVQLATISCRRAPAPVACPGTTTTTTTTRSCSATKVWL